MRLLEIFRPYAMPQLLGEVGNDHLSSLPCKPEAWQPLAGGGALATPPVTVSPENGSTPRGCQRGTSCHPLLSGLNRCRSGAHGAATPLPGSLVPLQRLPGMEYQAPPPANGWQASGLNDALASAREI